MEESKAGQSGQDTIQFQLNSATTNALSLADQNLSTLGQAQLAISAIDSAVNQLNYESSKLGAISNRLEFAHSNIYSSIQNTQSSLSIIRDADFAEEAANLAKSQILTQTGSAMIAQANNLSPNILSLIR